MRAAWLTEEANQFSGAFDDQWRSGLSSTQTLDVFMPELLRSGTGAREPPFAFAAWLCYAFSGSFSCPNLDNAVMHTHVHMYVHAHMHTVKLIPTGDSINLLGITSNEYTFESDMFANSTTVADNAAYYASGPDGVFNVSNCGFNAKV
jgi:hypothetical protein